MCGTAPDCFAGFFKLCLLTHTFLPIVFFFFFPIVLVNMNKLLPWTKKKEPSSRFAARRTLFQVWYHARSGAISAGQKSLTVADRVCPALIAPDQAWYHTWNSVLLAANLDDGSLFSSRVVLYRRKFSSAKNFRQKRPSGSSSGIYFRQKPVVARLLFARLLVKNISQEFNLVKKLLWRKWRN